MKANKKFKKLGPFRLPSMLSTGKVEEFQLYFYKFGDEDFYVIVKGNPKGKNNVLVRVHSACSFAHVFHSQRCDCQEQLDKAMQLIAKEGGILIYAWSHEGRGIGFEKHVQVYMKQDEGYDTVDSYKKLGLPVDKRSYTLCAEILKDFGIKRIRLLTNNPKKVEGLKKAGFEVERIHFVVSLNKFNEAQLKVKKEKLGHF